jgi:leucyl-tRNA synthetase
MTPDDTDSTSVYQPTVIEKKWQRRWDEEKINSPDLEQARRPFYQLMMFPYPSAEGLHIGNVYAFTGNDIHGRFQRLRGHDVFEPIGFDAFGIHSENHAIKVNKHPLEVIPRNIENFSRQLRRIGLMADWTHELSTTDASYYRWTQWLFLKLFEKGLAYKKPAAVNWCPECKTVLANEQVIGGECERHPGVRVEQRFLDQWFFRITAYAQRLLDNLDMMDWSENTKTAQRNWIGRSDGAEIVFPVMEQVAGKRSIPVFTTRPDTIFGATYLVLAPEHPLVATITHPDHSAEVAAYISRSAQRDMVTRKVGEREKTGVFTGAYAINPANDAPIPIWIADYVLMEYGTGAIMAVPAHDERDFLFAQLHRLPIVRVVIDRDQNAEDALAEAYTDTVDAALIHSGSFDGMPIQEAQRKITDWLVERGAARAIVNYRLHDWCISRQRYWGPPIPIIACDSCGPQAVAEQNLPVLLPRIEDFRPDDSGLSPLARHPEWYTVTCPRCGKTARRETDVSDTFLDSAWYFLRYPSAGCADQPFDPALTKRWLPVNCYIGGNEHAVLHLLYARFMTMVLHDLGYLPFEEPFTTFRAHGLIIRDGAKMSKSRGNVVNPDHYIDEWGADTVRMYLMFLGPFEQGGDFSDAGISGVRRFLDRLWSSVQEARSDGEADSAVLRHLHRTIKKVTDDTARLSYNTAIAAMMDYMNTLRSGQRQPHRAEVEPLVVLVAPYSPHIAEELWQQLGHVGSIFNAAWPIHDPRFEVEDTIELVVQVNGRMRAKIQVPREVDQGGAITLALKESGVRQFVVDTPKRIIYVPGRLLNIVV